MLNENINYFVNHRIAERWFEDKDLEMLRLSCTSIFLLFSARPPLALFISSLLLLSITAFSLALYVQSNTQIPNPDILDWSRLLEEMSELKYCLYSNPPTTTNTSDPSMVTAARKGIHPPPRSSLIKPAHLAMESFSAQGVIPLDHMGLGHAGQQVQVTFFKVGGLEEFCLQVRGAPKVLSSLIKSSNETECNNPKIDLNFTAHASTHLASSWCSNGSQFTFWPEILPSYSTKLTDAERALAVEHLTLSAFALLVLIVAVLLCAGRGGHTTEVRRRGEDHRGDLQLLSTVEDD